MQKKIPMIRRQSQIIHEIIFDPELVTGWCWQEGRRTQPTTLSGLLTSTLLYSTLREEKREKGKNYRSVGSEKREEKKIQFLGSEKR